MKIKFSQIFVSALAISATGAAPAFAQSPASPASDDTPLAQLDREDVTVVFGESIPIPAETIKHQDTETVTYPDIVLGQNTVLSSGPWTHSKPDRGPYPGSTILRTIYFQNAHPTDYKRLSKNVPWCKLDLWIPSDRYTNTKPGVYHADAQALAPFSFQRGPKRSLSANESIDTDNGETSPDFKAPPKLESHGTYAEASLDIAAPESCQPTSGKPAPCIAVQGLACTKKVPTRPADWTTDKPQGSERLSLGDLHQAMGPNVGFTLPISAPARSAAAPLTGGSDDSPKAHAAPAI